MSSKLKTSVSAHPDKLYSVERGNKNMPKTSTKISNLLFQEGFLDVKQTNKRREISGNNIPELLDLFDGDLDSGSRLFTIEIIHDLKAKNYEQVGKKLTMVDEGSLKISSHRQLYHNAIVGCIKNMFKIGSTDVLHDIDYKNLNILLRFIHKIYPEKQLESIYSKKFEQGPNFKISFSVLQEPDYFSFENSDGIYKHKIDLSKLNLDGYKVLVGEKNMFEASRSRKIYNDFEVQNSRYADSYKSRMRGYGRGLAESFSDTNSLQSNEWYYYYNSLYKYLNASECDLFFSQITSPIATIDSMRSYYATKDSFVNILIKNGYFYQYISGESTGDKQIDNLIKIFGKNDIYQKLNKLSRINKKYLSDYLDVIKHHSFDIEYIDRLLHEIDVHEKNGSGGTKLFFDALKHLKPPSSVFDRSIEYLSYNIRCFMKAIEMFDHPLGLYAYDKIRNNVRLLNARGFGILLYEISTKKELGDKMKHLVELIFMIGVYANDLDDISDLLSTDFLLFKDEDSIKEIIKFFTANPRLISVKNIQFLFKSFLETGNGAEQISQYFNLLLKSSNNIIQRLTRQRGKKFKRGIDGLNKGIFNHPCDDIKELFLDYLSFNDVEKEGKRFLSIAPYLDTMTKKYGNIFGYYKSRENFLKLFRVYQQTKNKEKRSFQVFLDSMCLWLEQTGAKMEDIFMTDLIEKILLKTENFEQELRYLESRSSDLFRIRGLLNSQDDIEYIFGNHENLEYILKHIDCGKSDKQIQEKLAGFGNFKTSFYIKELNEFVTLKRYVENPNLKCDSSQETIAIIKYMKLNRFKDYKEDRKISDKLSNGIIRNLIEYILAMRFENGASGTLKNQIMDMKESDYEKFDAYLSDLLLQSSSTWGVGLSMPQIALLYGINMFGASSNRYIYSLGRLSYQIAHVGCKLDRNRKLSQSGKLNDLIGKVVSEKSKSKQIQVFMMLSDVLESKPEIFDQVLEILVGMTSRGGDIYQYAQDIWPKLWKNIILGEFLKPQNSSKTEGRKINSRPMFTCVNEKTPVSSHKKLVEQFHQYLDNLNVELQLQSDDENGTMKKTRDFTSHLNQDLIQRYMPQFQNAFEGIVGCGYKDLVGYRDVIDPETTTPNYFFQEVSIGLHSNNNTTDLLKNFASPGGRYTIEGIPFDFGFYSIIKRTNTLNHYFRFGVILCDSKTTKKVKNECPNEFDSMMRFLSRVRQFKNHDRYHNSMIFESTDIQHNNVVNNYSGSYELHSGRIHGKLINDENNVLLLGGIIADMKYYVSLLKGMKCGIKEKIYFLKIYFYAFRRIIDQERSDMKIIIEEINKEFGSDISFVIDDSEEEEKLFAHHIHHGGPILQPDGTYKGFEEIFRL